MKSLVSLALASALVACGGPGGGVEAPEGAPTAADASAPSSPEAQCIAVANADHAKRADEPETITVSHVLVKHTASKNPKEGVTRTRGEACLRAMEARDKLRSGADFDSVAAEYSDEPGAASRAGSLGAVKRADLLPAFADAAFELDRAQLSDLVETDFGFHVILRTE